jgi:hypothetical protein
MRGQSRRSGVRTGLLVGGTAVCPARDVLTAERDGLAVLLDLRRQQFLGLDEVGTSIWRRIEAGATAAAIVSSVAADYAAPPETVRDDVRRFIAELQQRRLVVRS